MLNRSYNKGRPRAVAQSAKDAWRSHRSPNLTAVLAAHLGVSKAAVSKWRQVPEDRLAAVADFLGRRPADLRPDLYPAPWDALLPTQTRGAR